MQNILDTNLGDRGRPLIIWGGHGAKRKKKLSAKNKIFVWRVAEKKICSRKFAPHPPYD